jgi:hypothetical protein
MINRGPVTCARCGRCSDKGHYCEECGAEVRRGGVITNSALAQIARRALTHPAVIAAALSVPILRMK